MFLIIETRANAVKTVLQHPNKKGAIHLAASLMVSDAQPPSEVKQSLVECGWVEDEGTRITVAPLL